MLNDAKIEEFIEFIKENFSEKTRELVDSLDLVNLVFDDIYDLIKENIDKSYNEQKLDQVQNLISRSQEVLDIKNIILNYKDLLIDEIEEENIIIEEMADEELEKKNYPNYSEYYVDKSVPHTLYEDFTHTKACGFEFRAVKYEAKNMRDILVQLCELLAIEDQDKMKSFINDKTMQGRTAPYFSNKLIVEGDINKNEKISDLDVYVWINLSCNQIRNVIKRVLKKYDYKFEDFKIYLRADYTDLHKKSKENSIVKAVVTDSSKKIGKYVQSCFKQLENYPFTINELCAMQSEEWTLKTFGFSTPLLKKYDAAIMVSDQIKVNGYIKYWKNPYKLCGEYYFVVSQWMKVHRCRFDQWFHTLNR